MNPAIDTSLYPDCEPPTDLADESVAADYLVRVCGAYDFGMAPRPEVVATLREMRDIFDKYPLLDSMAYHALRRRFGWPELPHVGTPHNPATEQDCREGREPDPIFI
ncbi:MAG: hypothetical protein HYY24_06070 [Verrucomicrobia bacterium]|nr:hypothetical protein [Verrucomicrobiota bacterium]